MNQNRRLFIKRKKKEGKKLIKDVRNGNMQSNKDDESFEKDHATPPKIIKEPRGILRSLPDLSSPDSRRTARETRQER